MDFLVAKAGVHSFYEIVESMGRPVMAVGAIHPPPRERGVFSFGTLREHLDGSIGSGYLDGSNFRALAI